jgi:hypothetical protein
MIKLSDYNIKTLLTYDPETGVFTWLHGEFGRVA